MINSEEYDWTQLTKPKIYKKLIYKGEKNIHKLAKLGIGFRILWHKFSLQNYTIDKNHPNFNITDISERD